MSPATNTVAALFAESESVIVLDDRTISARSLVADGARIAAALSARGLATGDRIAVLAPNGPAYLRVLVAASIGRFVVVSVNTRFADAEATSLVTRSGAGLLVTDRALPAADHTPPLGVVSTAGIDALADDGEVDEAAHRAIEETEPREPAHDDPYVVFTTSGTTSAPKMVLHDQGSITVHSRQVADRFGYDAEARVLVVLPLCGVFGFDSLTAAVAGSSRIWMPSAFAADAVGRLVERERITAINGSDDMFHRLLSTECDLSSIEMAGYGRFNAALDDIVDRADRRGLRLTGIYGMSEVQALFTLRDPSGDRAQRSEAGGDLTSPGAAVRIADPSTGRPLPDGADGEIQLRGPSLFSGYLAEGGARIDDALTDAAHTTGNGDETGTGDDAGDGNERRWFRTGDLGRRDGPRRFTFLTRMGDALRLGGFLVNPAEIEEVVIRFPGVVDAQVVAAARPDGVRPVAWVIADRSVDGIDEAALIEHCGRHLARFKVPVRVFTIDEFPTTPSANGTKVQRHRLREWAEASLR